MLITHLIYYSDSGCDPPQALPDSCSIDQKSLHLRPQQSYRSTKSKLDLICCYLEMTVTELDSHVYANDLAFLFPVPPNLRKCNHCHSRIMFDT